jgi:hypothetical protein
LELVLTKEVELEPIGNCHGCPSPQKQFVVNRQRLTGEMGIDPASGILANQDQTAEISTAEMSTK